MTKRFFISLLLAGICLQAFANLQPSELTCEYTIDPLGISNKKPGLSWMLYSVKRNQEQSAYEIIVSENLVDITHLNGTKWTSGKIAGNQSVQIPYSGSPLAAFTKYYWKVRVFDAQSHPSDWSKTAWFETGLIDQGDWKAKWISDDRQQFTTDADFYKDDPMPLFKRTMKIRKKIAAARLFISGLGYYEAYINGSKIGNNVLDPGFTSYRKEVLYTTYDVTDLLKKGNNVLSVMLGNGWYNPLPIRLFGSFNLRTIQQTGRPCLTARLSIKYSDGTEDIILTDNKWLTATGQIVFNNVYLGEHDDGRLKRDDLFNDGVTGWKNAAIAKGPDGILSPQMQPPIKVTRIIHPVDIKEAGKDTFIVDMGQNFAGVTRIHVGGPAGALIKLRYGEALFPDGQLNYLTTVAGQIKQIWGLSGGPGAPKTAWQEDSYILAGKGTETWSPRFTFHGFRYVQITGWPGKPALKDIEGLRMNADLQQDGAFSCSNELFNKIHIAAQWTFLSNVFSVQSDCPGREKMGYGADMVVTSQSYCYNYNMANFYSKAVTDFANDQLADGGITEISPYTGIKTETPGGDAGPPGWELAFPYLQKQLYDYYGDKQLISKNYPAFKRQMDFLQSKAYENLYDHDIGDHAAIDPKPVAFDASLFYYHHALLAEDFAGILGIKEDSLKYARLAEKIKHAIIEKYAIPGTGRFDNGTESAEIFALWYGLPSDTKATYHELLKEFERHNFHISTGIFSTMMLFDILRESDKNELAFRIANQRDYPGWGYMLAKQATTLWETWDYPDNGASQNHPMFGSIEEWFYRSLLGINQGAPGFKKIIIKPQPTGDLSWAKGSYHSVYGNIISDWQKRGSSFNLHVIIPANTTAELWILANGKSSLSESGKQVDKIAGFKSLKAQNGYQVVSVGSGEYFFKSEVN